MQKQCCVAVTIAYDDEATDPATLADLVAVLLKDVTSTPGILDEYGDPVILAVEPSEPEDGRGDSQC